MRNPKENVKFTSMNKENIIKQLKKQFKCGDDEAEKMFVVGLKNGDIKKHIRWDKLLSFFILWSVILTGLWALYRVATQ